MNLTANKRRRIFYIDKIFQKKLMVLFLGVNAVIVAANIIYYLTHLKDRLEANMFRSHISISNLNELLAGDVIRFNLLLAVVCGLLVLAFYSFVRLRLNGFFGKLQRLLASRRKYTGNPEPMEISREFYDIDRVMGEFILNIDSRLADENKQLRGIKTNIN